MNLIHNGLLFVFIFSFSILAQSDLDTQLLQYFARIEDAQSTSAEVTSSMDTILKIGKKTLPYLQKRFRQTNHPRYWYLIQQIENQSVQETSNSQEQSNASIQSYLDNYFKQKFQQAQSLLNAGKTDEAEKIAVSILNLEPKIVFAQEIREFIRKCHNQAILQKIISGLARGGKKVYSTNSEIMIHLGFNNHQNIPIILLSDGIILEIQEQEFTLAGDYRERSLDNLVKLKEEIILQPGENWKWNTKITATKNPIRSYRKWEISAKVPRCRVLVNNNPSYPQIQFPAFVIQEIPQDLQYIIQDPLKFSLQAIERNQEEVVFFASFFLTPQENCKVIPKLIDSWPDIASYRTPLVVTLRNLTGKNFATKVEWKNWWASQNFSEK